MTTKCLFEECDGCYRLNNIQQIYCLFITIQNKSIIQNCPCFHCIVKSTCSKICTDRQDYVDYIRANSKKYYDKF